MRGSIGSDEPRPRPSRPRPFRPRTRRRFRQDRPPLRPPQPGALLREGPGVAPVGGGAAPPGAAVGPRLRDRRRPPAVRRPPGGGPRPVAPDAGAQPHADAGGRKGGGPAVRRPDLRGRSSRPTCSATSTRWARPWPRSPGCCGRAGRPASSTWPAPEGRRRQPSTASARRRSFRRPVLRSEHRPSTATCIGPSTSCRRPNSSTPPPPCRASPPCGRRRCGGWGRSASYTG